MELPPHLSVLLSEFMLYFDQQQIITFCDATLGAGGHSKAILENHPEIQKLVGIDQDFSSLNLARKRLAPWGDKVEFVHGNFGRLKEYADTLGISCFDGMIFDLGVSSMQLDQPERGFSFMREGPLDMRMNPEEDLTAEEIVNTWSEEDLGKIFRDYGEEKQWKLAAKIIVKERLKRSITTTQDLNAILYHVLKSRKREIHPLTLIFQALRICVNRELEMLEKALHLAITLLAPDGILGVISFHSLEDRIVKNIFRQAASDKHSTAGIEGLFLDKEPLVHLLTKKPIIPSDSEIQSNPRSRSAKLRVVKKL